MPLFKAPGVAVRRPTTLSIFSSTLMNGDFTVDKHKANGTAEASREVFSFLDVVNRFAHLP
jgi:hypothetical protein